MSGEWDEEPRPRRRRFEDVSLRRGGQLSGGVTAAGVFTIVMGGLSLLCFFCSGLMGLLFFSLGELGRQQGNFLPGTFGAAGGVLLGLALLYLLVGVCYLIAGIVTLQRRNWGRVFALAMGCVSVLLGLAQGVFAVLGFMGMDPFMAGGDPEAQVVNAALNLFVGLVYLAHAVVVFATLLSSYNIAEFE